MTEPKRKRVVEIVLIPREIYKQIDEIAKKEGSTVMGVLTRILIDFLKIRIKH